MDYPQMHAQVLTWCYCYEIPYKRKNHSYGKEKKREKKSSKIAENLHFSNEQNHSDEANFKMAF